MSLRDLESSGAEYFHLIIESMKLAIADRKKYFGAPCFVDVAMSALLSDSYVSLRRGLIESATALPYDLAGDPLALKPVIDDAAVAQGGTNGTIACIVGCV